VKGQPPKGGQSASPITMHREGIKKSIHGKACAMQSTNTYLGLLRERGKRGLPLRRVYRQLFNKHLYLTAYGKIYRNAGATTKGVTEETVDAMPTGCATSKQQVVSKDWNRWLRKEGKWRGKE